MTQVQTMPKWHTWIATIMVSVLIIFLSGGHASAQTMAEIDKLCGPTVAQTMVTTQPTATPAKHQRPAHHRRLHHRLRHHVSHHGAAVTNAASNATPPAQADTTACLHEQLAVQIALRDDPTIGYKALIDKMGNEIGTLRADKNNLTSERDAARSQDSSHAFAMWCWLATSLVLLVISALLVWRNLVIDKYNDVLRAQTAQLKRNVDILLIQRGDDPIHNDRSEYIVEKPTFGPPTH